MKAIFTIGLLAVALLLFVSSLDFVIYRNLSVIVQKEIKPFKVTEETEVITLLIFAFYFIIKAVMSFIKKIQNRAQNKPN